MCVNIVSFIQTIIIYIFYAGLWKPHFSRNMQDFDEYLKSASLFT